MKKVLGSRLPRVFLGQTSSLWSWPASQRARQLVPFILLVIALSALAIFYMRYQQWSYKPLFGTGEAVALDDVVSVLDAEHITYRIHPETGQILVSSADFAGARLTLAAKGVSARLPEGLEQIGQHDPLGTSQFVQDVRFRRGLEAELIKSITSIDAIKNARVHLSIAKSSSFVMMDGEKSAASVVLTVKPGKRLSKEQIAAVINLVAGSVPNLAPDRVAVIDQSGGFLSSRVDLADSHNEGSDVVAQFRDEALNNVQDLLAPTLGLQNFRVSITAVATTDRSEETREILGDTPKVINESLREETDSDRLALGIPGSLSNRPVALEAAEKPASPEGVAKRNATTRQFSYDRNVVHIKHRPGRLEKLSVAVIVNNAAAPTAGQAWSTEQLGALEAVLRSGLGMQQSRGDQLIVTAMDFPKEPDPVAWWRDPAMIQQFASYLAGTIALIVVWMLLLRPVIRMGQQWCAHTFGDHANAATVTASPSASSLQPVSNEGLAPGTEDDATTPKHSAGSQSLWHDVHLPPENSGVAVLISHLQQLVEKNPQQVNEVIRRWIHQEGQVHE